MIQLKQQANELTRVCSKPSVHNTRPVLIPFLQIHHRHGGWLCQRRFPLAFAVEFNSRSRKPLPTRLPRQDVAQCTAAAAGSTSIAASSLAAIVTPCSLKRSAQRWMAAACSSSVCITGTRNSIQPFTRTQLYGLCFYYYNRFRHLF